MLKPILAFSNSPRIKPAAFRRLCVETADALKPYSGEVASRLQAAVC